MKYSLWILAGSLVSGLICGSMQQPLGLQQDFWWWFLFGSCACFYSFGYVEAMTAFWKWWRTQPKFKGFKYWIKKTLGLEISKKETTRE